MPKRNEHLRKYWSTRVAGQVRSCCKAHPDWIREGCADRLVNSITKRVVGEILVSFEAGQGHEDPARVAESLLDAFFALP